MMEYLNEVVNPDKPWLFMPDTKENILLDMALYPLDPIFELYGDFVNTSPIWQKEEYALKYAGCTVVFGNFLNVTHAFRVVTDDTALITELTEAIKANKATEAYQKARRKMLDDLPVLSYKNAYPGRFYAFPGGWMRLMRTYRLTEAEANEHSLLYLNRWEGIDHKGEHHNGAFGDGEKIPSSKGWAIYREEEI